MDCFHANRFKRGEIESIFSEALGRFEINVSEHGLFTVKRDQLESDARTGFAHFLGVKTAGSQRQLADDALDQRRLSAPRTTCEQDFSDHIITLASSNVRRTKQCVRRSLPISIRDRNAGICRLCRDAASAM